LADVVPVDAVGIFGCAPIPLSAELHLLAALQTQCIGTHSVDRVGAKSASSVLHFAPWSARCTQPRFSLHRTIAAGCVALHQDLRQSG